MGNIRTIFDEESDLHDLRADPNMVIEIQKLVTEMLGANEHRRIGIRQEIVDKYGVAALPGVISATFVLTKQLSNRKNQQMLAELIRELAADNPGAIRMLVKAGVADNPFAESRAVMVEALAGLDAALAVREMAPALLKAAERAKKVFDHHAARQIYEMLLQHGLGFDEALAACRMWFSSDVKVRDIDEAVPLFTSLLRLQPTRTEDLLFDQLTLLKPKDPAKANLRDHLRLPSTSSVLPAMRAGDRLIKRESTKRSNIVESLYTGAITKCIVDEPQIIPAIFHELDTSNFEQTTVRYWWRALSQAASRKSDAARRAFFEKLQKQDDYISQVWAVVSILFLVDRNDASTHTWVNSIRQQVDSYLPDVLKAAIELKKQIDDHTRPGPIIVTPPTGNRPQGIK
jgi:hypothetical protein